MAISRLSGPVYGAKSNLLSAGPIAAANSSTGLVATAIVPPYETWYLTEVGFANVQGTSNSSTPKILVKVKGTNGADPLFPAGNPGTAGSVVGGTSTGTFNLVGTLTATAGEYEGYAAPANSTIRIVSSGTIGLLFARLNGFIRYIDSTRSA